MNDLGIITPFQHLKLFFLHAWPLARDGYHIYIGFFVLVVGARLWRRRIGDPLALLVPFGVAVVLELFDLRDDLTVFGYFRYWASAWDVMNTMLIPIVLTMVAHPRFKLFSGEK